MFQEEERTCGKVQRLRESLMCLRSKKKFLQGVWEGKQRVTRNQAACRPVSHTKALTFSAKRSKRPLQSFKWVATSADFRCMKSTQTVEWKSVSGGRRDGAETQVTQ